MADGIAGAPVVHEDAILTVKGDRIACAAGSAADDIIGRPQVPEGDGHSIASVAQRQGAGRVGADEVTFYHVVITHADRDAVSAIAGNEVAGSRRRAADYIVRATVDAHSSAVRHGPRAENVGPDVVALYLELTPSIGPIADCDARYPVAGDQIAGPGLGSSNEPARPYIIGNQTPLIGKGEGAGGVGAEIVTLNPNIGSSDRNTAVVVAGDLSCRRLGRRLRSAYCLRIESKYRPHCLAQNGR